MRSDPDKTIDKGVLVHILFAGGVLIGFAAVMAWQPILADEWDFYRAAADWAHDRALIPHPQAYVHLLQASLALFGKTPGSARIPGILTALLNLALIPMIVKAFWGDTPTSRRIAIAAVWLYALAPLTPQNMMLVDIDNTLLTTVLLSFIWLWKRTQDWPSPKRITALSIALAAALWTKLPTPVVLIGSLGLFYLLRWDLRRLIELALITAGGGLLFVVSFALYGQLTGFTFAFFGPAFGNLSSTGDFRGLLPRVPQTMGVFVLWLSLPVTALLTLVLFQTVGRVFNRQLEDRDFLVIYVAAMMAFYAVIMVPAWGYPRYHAPAVPVIAVLVAALLLPVSEGLPRKVWLLAAALGIAYVVYALVVIGDPLWDLYTLTFETDLGDLPQRLREGMTLIAQLSFPLVIGMAIGLFFLVARWRLLLRPAGIYLLGILAAASMLSTLVVQIPADYSTRYRYTYRYDDLFQAIDTVKAVGGTTLAIKDVLYDAGVPGEEIYPYVCPACLPQGLLDKLRGEQIDTLVWTTKEDNRSPAVTQSPEVRETLDRCYRRVDHGVFITYRRTSEGPCE
ncbi:MAG: glycosyltransferase family 39 protein [Anaerolineae bacterium]|jgi:hypothetical protein|nr:glycosyltransferase family 39 protein [Anaerolineae bacterium]